jgi:hypothetical protein
MTFQNQPMVPSIPAILTPDDQQVMLWRSIGTFTPEGKYVAALSHYRTKLRDVPPSFDNDRSTAR